MSLLSVIACAALAVCGASHHECVHDQLLDELSQGAEGVERDERELKSQAPQNYNITIGAHGRVLQDVWSPIRIKVDVSKLYPYSDGNFACYTGSPSTYKNTLAPAATITCADNLILTDVKRDFLISTLLPAAVGFFEKALSVRPVLGNLKLTSTYAYSSSCGSSYNLVCCPSNIPDEYKTTGVANADYVLIVTARPTAGSTLAWATECQSDQYARPTMGQANIGPSSISTDPANLAAQVGVVAHEIAHALGFSSSKFSSFRKAGTLERTASTVVETKFDANLGKTVSRIITPKVAEFLKTHLKCDTWPGIGGELEEYGGSGTAGSHWEKRMVMNELMNPVSEAYMIKSGLTLALFEDSGWYKSDFSLAEKLSWGAGQGCDFLKLPCNKGWSSDYFCRTVMEQGCTPDMRFQAACNLDDSGVSYPTQYQYFDNKGMGGKQPHTDYCPYYQAYTSRDCSNAASISYFFYGERPGTGSRCFQGTYQMKAVSGSPEMHAGCLQAACNKLTNLLEVTLSGTPSTVITCPQAGGSVDVSQYGEKWIGTLNCPPASKLCTGKPCDIQDCSGNGVCNSNDGSCTCNPGFYGEPATGTKSIYSCPFRTCPGTNVNGSLVCSGHGSCNKISGICTDGTNTGVQGCFPGYSGSDCSVEGCPKHEPLGECSGRGACVLGSCQCNATFIGSDCFLSDCPYAIAGDVSTRCNGAQQGVCNMDLGVCECTENRRDDGSTVHYRGASCETVRNSTLEYTPLSYVGESNGEGTNNTNGPVATRLLYKAYQYFTFRVPTTQYKITLFATALDYAASTSLYFTASYFGSARPTGTDGDFISTRVDDYTRVIFLSPSTGSGTSAFSKTGTIYVALVSLYSGSINVNVSLVRDGCAVMTCAHGTCSNGRCICDTANEYVGSLAKTYGWSGTLCDQPDCPGSPDCSSSKRGECITPSTAFNPNGTASRGTKSLPYCRCNGIFSGASCASYASLLDSGTVVPGRPEFGWDYRAQVTALFNPAVNVVVNEGANSYFIKRDALNVSTLNLTISGKVEAGSSVAPIAIDQTVVLGDNRFKMKGTMGLYIRMDGRASPKADPIMLGDIDSPPSLSSYRDFQESSWRAGTGVQEIATVLNPSAGPEGDFYAVTLQNGRYGQEPLQYTLYMEISTGCPPSLRGCSGHGSCKYKCECERGYEGLKCERYIPEIGVYVVPVQQAPPPPLNASNTTRLLAVGAPAPAQRRVRSLVSAPTVTFTPTLSPVLDPGAGQIYIVEALEDAKEVSLDMTAVSAGRVSLPVLRAAWSSYRGNADTVSSSLAVYDYDGMHTGNSSQSLVIRRTNPSQQVYLYISVSNGATARSAFQAVISMQQTNASVVPLCTGNATVCRNSVCKGRGSYTTIAGVPSCVCDLGWNSDTMCSSPSFRSLQDVPSAAQSVGFLCSVCSESAWFERDGVLIFKVPQPLQKSTALQLTVAPVAGIPPNASSASVDVNGAKVTTAVTMGVPALLISTVLPRSLLDFGVVASIIDTQKSSARRLGVVNASTPNSVSVTLSEPSPTGNYWIAVYATSPGTFTVAAARSRFADKKVAFKLTLVEGIDKWLLTTTAGITCVAIGATLCFLTFTSCLCQCFCGRVKAIGKVREVLERMEDAKRYEMQLEEEREEKRMAALQKVAASGALASRPALARAISIRLQRPGSAPAPSTPLPQHRIAKRTAGPSLLMQAMAGGDSELDGKVAQLSAQAQVAQAAHAAGQHSSGAPKPAGHLPAGTYELQSILMSAAAGGRAPRAAPVGRKGGSAPPPGTKPGGGGMAVAADGSFGAVNPLMGRH